MSAGWKTATVGESIVPVAVAGKSKIQTKDYKNAGPYPIVDQGQAPIAGWTDSLDAVVDAPLPLIVFGDHSRTFKFLDRPFARGADGTQLLRPVDEIDPLFFYYACRAIDLPSRGYNRHFRLLKEKEIAYPTDGAAQRSIAALLRRAERAVVLQDELAVLLEQAKAATMQQLFARGLRGQAQQETEIGPIPESWELVALGEVREFLQYGTSVQCTLSPKKYPVLRIPNIEPGRVNNSELKYCNLPEAQANKYLLENGDLLFIRTNGVIDRLGSCAVFDGAPDSALFASYLIRARLTARALPKFVAYFYGSTLGTSLVGGRATPASDGKYNLNTGTIDALPLPLPPTTEEQQAIVDVLDALDRKIDLHRRKREVLDQLFKSLLHKLMTGEVSVEDLDLSALPTLEGSAA